jgi:hypothetical protein
VPERNTCSFVRRVLQTPVTSIMVMRNGITALTAMIGCASGDGGQGVERLLCCYRIGNDVGIENDEKMRT